MKKGMVSNKIAKLRILQLIENGYSKAEIARMTKLNSRTIYNILNPQNEVLQHKTHNIIVDLWDKLEEQKANEQTTDNYFMFDEDVIDSKDAEEGAKQVAKWMYITFIVVGILLIGMMFLIKYIVNL